MEITPLGQRITRTNVCVSLNHFESHYINCDWSFLSSVDRMQHHATWINRQLHQLMTFCEGDVITIHCDSEQSFAAEQLREIQWCDSNR